MSPLELVLLYLVPRAAEHQTYYHFEYASLCFGYLEVAVALLNTERRVQTCLDGRIFARVFSFHQFFCA